MLFRCLPLRILLVSGLILGVVSCLFAISFCGSTFISEDPIGFKGEDVNLYAYVLNNPANFRDPLGKRREDRDRPGDIEWARGLKKAIERMPPATQLQPGSTIRLAMWFLVPRLDHLRATPTRVANWTQTRVLCTTAPAGTTPKLAGSSVRIRLASVRETSIYIRTLRTDHCFIEILAVCSAVIRSLAQLSAPGQEEWLALSEAPCWDQPRELRSAHCLAAAVAHSLDRKEPSLAAVVVPLWAAPWAPSQAPSSVEVLEPGSEHILVTGFVVEARQLAIALRG
jgi:hypothetical protein